MVVMESLSDPIETVIIATLLRLLTRFHHRMCNSVRLFYCTTTDLQTDGSGWAANSIPDLFETVIIATLLSIQDPIDEADPFPFVSLTAKTSRYQDKKEEGFTMMVVVGRWQQ